ncbi:MAG: hypothetical protein ACJ74O_13060 [Frankiaceae bacterium]
MPLTARSLLVAAVMPLLLVTGCGAGDRPSSAGATSAARIDRPYVLVSGRDDHGLREMASVPELDAPVEGRRIGYVADGTLARVLDVRGSWLEVAPISGGAPPGWIDDYRLRGVVHLVGPAPSCRAVLDGRPLAAGEQAEVLDVRGDHAWVRLVRRRAVTGAVPLRWVRELPPSPGDPCPRR